MFVPAVKVMHLNLGVNKDWFYFSTPEVIVVVHFCQPLICCYLVCFFLVRFSFKCCDSAVLMVWLGSGTKTLG